MTALCKKIGLLLSFMLATLPVLGVQQVPNTANDKNPALQIAGDWQGALQVGGQELHVVLHITQTSDGALKASMDSIDQGANGIAIDEISFQGGNLSFSSAAVHGSYKGKLNVATAQIEGTWTQGQPLPLNFKRAVQASDIDGLWLGTLETGGQKLRLLFQITNTPEGLHASLNSLDQGSGAIAVSSIARDGARLTIELKSINGAFSGTLNHELTTIEGTWTQGGASLPLVLKKAKPEKIESAAPRPQDPKKPYPYREEDVTIKTGRRE